MSNKNDGGPAFPTENGRQIGNNTFLHEGMTLRDYFAAHAVCGILSNPSLDVRDGHNNKITNIQGMTEGLARDAFKFADAMIAERNK